MSQDDQIYCKQALEYERMVSHQSSLVGEINAIRRTSGLNILDLGAGSGRLSADLATEAKSIMATDSSPQMLNILKEKWTSMGFHEGRTALGDHRQIALDDRSIDLITAGWTLCYLTSTSAADWETNLVLVMREMERVLRPDGTIVILETMGTGVTEPAPPDYLKPYYDRLESSYGFSRKVIRTDYTFATVEDAVQHTEFFFGEALVEKIRSRRWSTVPEYAGLWFKHMDGNVSVR